MESLTKFFNESKRLLENFDKDKLSADIQSIFNNIIEDSKKYFENAGFKNIFNTYKKQLIASVDNEIDQLRIFFRMLKDDIIQDTVFRFLISSIDNIEEILFKTGEFNKNFYYELKCRILKSNEKNFEYTSDIIERYSKIEAKIIKVNKIINSISLIKEQILEEKNNDNEKNEKRNSFSILNFKMNFDKFISFLKDCDEETFEIYLFDFLIKFSFIIESHIKNIMKFLLKLDNLLNDKKYNVDEYSLSKLFWLLRQDQIFRDYRNAIFHSDFVIKYNFNFNEIRIIFNANEEPIRWTVTEVFENFTKIVLLINTFNIAILSLNFEKKDLIELINSFFDIINELTIENFLEGALKFKEFVDLESKTINQELFKNYLKEKIIQELNKK